MVLHTLKMIKKNFLKCFTCKAISHDIYIFSFNIYSIVVLFFLQSAEFSIRMAQTKNKYDSGGPEKIQQILRIFLFVYCMYSYLQLNHDNSKLCDS